MTARGEEAKRKSAALLHFPYQSPAPDSWV